MDIDKPFVVTVCVYEGIEKFYGPFNREDALGFALELKTLSSARSKKTMKNYKPDQVCIQKAPEKVFRGWNKERTIVLLKKNVLKEFACCCKEFSELPKNKNGPWFMG